MAAIAAAPLYSKIDIFFFKFEGDNNFFLFLLFFSYFVNWKKPKKSKTNKNKTNSQKIFLKEDQCILIIVFNQIVGILFFLELKHSKGLNFFQGIKRVKDLREGCTFELSHECLLFFVFNIWGIFFRISISN